MRFEGWTSRPYISVVNVRTYKRLPSFHDVPHPVVLVSISFGPRMDFPSRVTLAKLPRLPYDWRS
jgi:hypothetical protein